MLLYFVNTCARQLPFQQAVVNGLLRYCKIHFRPAPRDGHLIQISEMSHLEEVRPLGFATAKDGFLESLPTLHACSFSLLVALAVAPPPPSWLPISEMMARLGLRLWILGRV